MATSSSKTTTRKASTSRAASSTSTSKSDEATPAPEDPAAATSPGTPPVSDQTSDQAGAQVDDPAAALKKQIRTTQHVETAREDTLTDEQRLNLVGAPAGALPGPRTLSTPTAPVRRGEEYVTAESDGYVATVPDRAKQPATVRVWIEGQRVRKDMHDTLSGIVATDAKDAPILTGDDYAKVAPYL